MRSDKVMIHEDWQGIPFRSFVARKAGEHGNRLPADVAPKGSLPARVNHGRWVVDCPVAGCGGAMIPSQTDPVFLCPYCGNRDNGGVLYAVIFPTTAKAIEIELMKRSQAINRNWEPGETVAILRTENAIRGIN